MSSDAPALGAQPWETDDLLPPKPSDGTYGFVAGRKAKACTLDELVTMCSAVQIPDVGLVWTPQTARLVPMREVSELRPAVASRVRSMLRWNGGMLALAAVFSLIDSPRIRLMMLLTVGMPSLQGVIDGLLALRTQRRQRDRSEPARDVGTRFGVWVGRQKTHVTNAAAAALVLVVAAQLWSGRSVEAAGLVKQAVRDGQLWRLATGPLLHANPWHFVGNALALLALGRTLEALAHWSRLAIVLCVSMLVGSVFSQLLLPATDSVGASGGILGLLGFLAVLGVRRRDALPAGFTASLAHGVVWVALTGVAAYAVIDNAAHAGGLLAGLALGWLLVPAGDAVPLPADGRLRAGGVAATAVLAAAAAGCLVALLRG